MFIALLSLALGCGGGTLGGTDTGTGDTGQTEVDTGRWQATFWKLEHGAWINTAGPLEERVRGLEMDTYSEVLSTGGGEHIYQWSAGTWAQLDYDPAPGPIDAYEATWTNTYIAVGDRLYMWTENPGVWARWLEKAPGEVSALSYSTGTSSHAVAVGAQLHRFTEEDTWEELGSPVAVDIQCMHRTYQRTFVAAGGVFYTLEEDVGWVGMELPDAPEPDVGGCAYASSYVDGEQIDEYYLVTNREVR